MNIVRAVRRAAAEMRGEPMSSNPEEGTMGEADVTERAGDREKLEDLEVAP